MNNIDDFTISIESDVLSNDFDDVDLYGNKYEKDENNECDDNIQYE